MKITEQGLKMRLRLAWWVLCGSWWGGALLFVLLVGQAHAANINKYYDTQGHASAACTAGPTRTGVCTLNTPFSNYWANCAGNDMCYWYWGQSCAGSFDPTTGECVPSPPPSYSTVCAGQYRDSDSASLAAQRYAIDNSITEPVITLLRSNANWSTQGDGCGDLFIGAHVVLNGYEYRDFAYPAECPSGEDFNRLGLCVASADLTVAEWNQNYVLAVLGWAMLFGLGFTAGRTS